LLRLPSRNVKYPARALPIPTASPPSYYDDAYAKKTDLVDIPFYVDLAKKMGGTGRVLLPTARAGAQIHGVDNSKPMIRSLTAHLQQETEEVRKRVTLSEGDMRNFRLNQKFALVTIPFHPMQHMYTVEDQLRALQTAASHLRDNGILAFDVFFPKFDKIDTGIGEEFLELEWPLRASPTRRVQRYFRKESVDKVNQTFSATFLFRTYEGEKLIAEETEPLKMSYYAYPQLRALFLLADLEIVEEYGSFSKKPLTNDATDMVFLLKRST
jgi:SAM-dependent methyltransferase